MTNHPKVSVVTITYGHQDYIIQTIEGVLMQHYQDEIEFIIANDNSPDHTDVVIRDYLLKTSVPPNITIKYTKHEHNKGMMPNFIWALEQATGEYIALCEGDDYWIDPLKLQRQVDFLEQNKEYSMVFSNAEVLIEVENSLSNSARGLVVLPESKEYTDIEILENWIVPTASVVFRAKFIDDKCMEIIKNKTFIYGDIVLFLFLLKQGKAFGMEAFTSTYRRQEGGVTNVKKNNLAFDKNYFNHLNEIINQFGLHLKTKKIRIILSKLALSLSLSNMDKKNVISGIVFLTKSIKYDSNAILNYVKSKI